MSSPAESPSQDPGASAMAVVRNKRSRLRRILFRIRRVVARLIPETWRVRFRKYRPDHVALVQWDQDYSGGAWDHLGSLPELPRYSIIVGYYGFLGVRGAVLDVGCGTGVLQRRLSTYGYERYTGLDHSQVAVDKARNNADESTEFLCADANRYEPTGTYDFLVLNEVLYYLDQPLDTLRRFVSHVSDHGVVVISMYRLTSTQKIWQMLDEKIPPGDTVKLETVNGHWTVKAYRKKAFDRLLAGR